jgi:hypothetical protein
MGGAVCSVACSQDNRRKEKKGKRKENTLAADFATRNNLLT